MMQRTDSSFTRPAQGPSPGSRIVVGMSGGVDSSVAAALLQEQGFEVIGLFMKNWEEKDENGVCSSARDYEDVARVCEVLGIPYYGIEFVEEYRERVFASFVEDYRRGYTPNPDILCNREIKFDLFFKKATELGAQALATGHYAQLGAAPGNGGVPKLLRAVDGGKDQTYFLHAVAGQVFSRVLFPIGHIEKPRLREIARARGLPTHSKKDSTGICFIGERNFRKFLSQYIPAKPGEIRSYGGGEVLGEHQGSAYYTLGQRKGLGLGGEGEAYFVVAKDPEANVLFVERGTDHPALYSDWCVARSVAWVSGAAPGELPYACTAKARYRQDDQACRIEEGAKPGELRVVFERPQRSLTPGQSVVFYQGEACLGGGVIDQVGPNYAEQGLALPRLA